MVWNLVQVAGSETGLEDEDVSLFPRKTARLVVASPLDRIRDLRSVPALYLWL